MRTHMSQGWRLALKHFYLVLLLFVYQFVWGFFLYRMIDGIVAPLLRRLPADAPSEGAMRHFMAEAQFQLFKTDMAAPYLWMLGGLFAARMLLTPLFNAGLLYSLHQQTRDGGGTRFFEGIRKVWKPVTLLYWLQAVLAIAPGWWLVPRGLNALLRSDSIPELAAAILPGGLLWLLWGMLLGLLFLAMQFGAVSGEGVFVSLWRSLRRFLAYAGITLLMWAVGALFSFTVSGLSFLVAGLFALIAHQVYPFIRTFIQIWTLAAQLNVLSSEERG